MLVPHLLYIFSVIQMFSRFFDAVPSKQKYLIPTAGRKETTMPSANFPPFDSKSFLASLGDGHAVSDYAEGNIVFAQGDVAKDIYFVITGNVKLSVVSGQGKEAIIGTMADGHFFGEAAISGQRTRLSTATAMCDSRIANVAKQTMIDMLARHASFSKFFIVHLLTRNIRVEADLVDQLFNSSEKRLARILLLLTNIAQDDRQQTVVPNVTQEALAAMVGTTRSRVSHFMNKFRDLGFIEYNGQIHVNSSLLSVVLHD